MHRLRDRVGADCGKNRSIPGFFFLGLVLGLAGLIFAACVQSHRQPATTSAPAHIGPAGWFPDPYGSGGMRWFDGIHWGSQTADIAPAQFRSPRHTDGP